MGNERKLTKAELLEIARAIATGGNVTEIAGKIGVDRTTLSGWTKGDTFLGRIAVSMPSPAVLGEDVLEMLRDLQHHDGERESARNLRLRLWKAVRLAHPDYFKKECAAREIEERARKRVADAAARRAERREIEAEKREELAAQVIEADYFNLQTLVETCKRNWRDGTADERARGLDTPDQRRAYRCRHGVKWDCAGFGVYYSPTWSAARCKMEYCDAEDGFYAIADNPDFSRAWAEIEAEQAAVVAERYQRDPFKRRDPHLPTTPAEAETLWQRISSGTDFADALPVRREC